MCEIHVYYGLFLLYFSLYLSNPLYSWLLLTLVKKQWIYNICLIHCVYQFQTGFATVRFTVITEFWALHPEHDVRKQWPPCEFGKWKTSCHIPVSKKPQSASLRSIAQAWAICGWHCIIAQSMLSCIWLVPSASVQPYTYKLTVVTCLFTVTKQLVALLLQ